MHSGQITVTTAGLEVQGPNIGGHIFALKGHPSNTNQAWVGNASNTISNTTGFPLAAGGTLIIRIDNLNKLYFDVSVNGEKICWIKVV